MLVPISLMVVSSNNKPAQHRKVTLQCNLVVKCIKNVSIVSKSHGPNAIKYYRIKYKIYIIIILTLYIIDERFIDCALHRDPHTTNI